MAGNYPDVPGPRMAYHLDGTVGFLTSSPWGSPPTQLTPQQMLALNNESTSSALGTYGPNQSRGIGLIFPELRDLSGIIMIDSVSGPSGGGTPGALEWSPNSTNGIDGDWTTITSNYPRLAPPSKVGMRTQIMALDVTGAKAIRYRGQAAGGSNQITTVGLHVYGRISAGQTPDRLRLWHPTLDEEVSGAYFDWGDVARGSSATINFRVKNNSATLAAVGITVGVEHPTDASPSLTDQIRLSTASSPTVEGQKNLGDLNPGEISEIVTLHRDLDPAAQLSLWWSLITAEATSWGAE